MTLPGRRRLAHPARRWLGVLGALVVLAATQALLHPFVHLPAFVEAAHTVGAAGLDEAGVDLPGHVEDILCFDCVAGQVTRVALAGARWAVGPSLAGASAWPSPPCAPAGTCPAQPRSRSPPPR